MGGRARSPAATAQFRRDHLHEQVPEPLLHERAGTRAKHRAKDLLVLMHMLDEAVDERQSSAGCIPALLQSCSQVTEARGEQFLLVCEMQI